MGSGGYRGGGGGGGARHTHTHKTHKKIVLLTLLALDVQTLKKSYKAGEFATIVVLYECNSCN